MINIRKCFIFSYRNLGMILFYITKEEGVTFLKSLNFECEIHDSGLKITSFPHLKLMCLKVCKKNPKVWRYEDEENGNYLFRLIISVDECRVIKSEKDVTEE